MCNYCENVKGTVVCKSHLKDGRASGCVDEPSMIDLISPAAITPKGHIFTTIRVGTERHLRHILRIIIVSIVVWDVDGVESQIQRPTGGRWVVRT